MNLKFKPKPFGILLVGIGIAIIGALAKIMKEDFAVNILAIALITEIIGLYIFFRWYFKMRKIEKNADQI